MAVGITLFSLFILRDGAVSARRHSRRSSVKVRLPIPIECRLFGIFFEIELSFSFKSVRFYFCAIFIIKDNRYYVQV